ncbi:hypothetical protein [Hyphococcus lacteus]|uniref:Uncharacterized protein n=1 Tax=Hyphococcus lacteus TaxID=3143536 RepID=A0ABV3Z4M6_9PROT
MKKLIIMGIVGSVFGFSTAVADDSMSACLEFADRNNVSPEPCACIAAAVANDPALKAEQIALVTLDDFVTASPELQSALDDCVD